MRTSFIRGIITVAGIVTFVACGGEAMNVNQMPPGEPPAPERGIQLKTTEFTVMPGQERYLCWAVSLTEAAEVAVTKIDVFAKDVVHHVLVSRTTADEPDQSECPELAKITWQPFYGGGKGTPGLTLPEGAGFKLARNARLVVQLHLLNATSQPVTERTFVNLTYAPDASKVVPAGFYTLGSVNIKLAPGANGAEVSAGCAAQKDLNVFAALPHMHQMGTRISFDHGATQESAQQVFVRDPWRFGEQEMAPIKLAIKKGDYLRTTCRYNNTTDQPVGWGESSLDEMCFFALFYTPFTDSQNACIK